MTKTSSNTSFAAKHNLVAVLAFAIVAAACATTPLRDTKVRIVHSAPASELAKYELAGSIECEANLEIQEDSAADHACHEELKDRAENIEADFIVIDKRDRKGCTWTSATCLHMAGRAFKTGKQSR